MRRNPLVGLGVVGTKTDQTTPWSIRACTSPWVLLVRKPIAQVPLRGNSTRTTLLKSWCFWVLKVSTTCLTVM